MKSKPFTVNFIKQTTIKWVKIEESKEQEFEVEKQSYNLDILIFGRIQVEIICMI